MQSLKIVAISDTHCTRPKLPDGDILLHAGDLTMAGTLEEFQDAEEWFQQLRKQFQRIYYVPGNHDWLAFKDKHVIKYDVFKSATWLVDDEIETLGGLRIYGSPWTQTIHGAKRWGYPLLGGTHNMEKWNEFPEGLDILLLHSPAYKVLDSHWITGTHLGDSYLKHRLMAMEKPPKMVVHGHIHEFGGRCEKHTGQHGDEIVFLNVSICDEGYRPTNPVTVIEFSANAAEVYYV